ncbi:MAG: TIGR02996 domain-containing protein [Gemmataceae bacterium]
MTDEDKLIRAILADPSNHVVRLVYADWLEERGDTTSLHQAEYLRVECELDTLVSDEAKHRRLRKQLRELRELVGDDWWRQFDWAKVEYCVEFQYKCPQRWDTLDLTENPAVRSCSSCQQKVYYCESVEEAHRLADANECVAIDSRLAKTSLGRFRKSRKSGKMLGRVTPRVPRWLPLFERATDCESDK